MKKLIAVLILLTFILSLTGCGDKHLTFDIGEASRIHVRSGLTGDKADIDDQALIRSITEDINALRFERTASSNGENGYAYALTWYDAEENQIVKITISDVNGYQINHDGYYYKVCADLSIDVDLFAKMLCE